MDINDIFGSDPTRPDHPDVWRLSQEIMRLDAIAKEERLGLRDRIYDEIGTHVDLESFKYVVNERARRLATSLEATGMPAPIVMLVEAAIGAAYIEAFVVTTRFHEAKAQQGGEVA